MPVSEAHHDATPLLRLEYPSFTGHIGHVAPHGVEFVDGVAQNGATETAATRLIGCIGPSLKIVGPWESTSAPTGLAPSVPAAVEAVEPAPLPVRLSKPARGR